MSPLPGDVSVPPGEEADSTPQPRSRGPVDVLVRILCALAVCLVAAAGLVAATASDATVMGKVEGGGWGGRGCYPTVSYVVDGHDYLLHAERDTRWCGLHMAGPAQVYYDPDEPRQARLSRYGELPGHLLALALGSLVIAALLSTRRRAPAAPLRGRVPHLLVTLLIAAWLVASIAVVVNGERASSLEDLQAAIDRGEVHQVRERGALSAGERDIAAVRLSWREGGLRHFATVTQYRGRAEVSRVPDGAADVVVGDLAAHLSSAGQKVEVEPDLRSTAPTFTTYTTWGWHVFGWPGYLTIALLLITARVLIVAEPPRLATRWAWFWLIAAAPVPFALAYLTLGGPGGRDGRSIHGSARLGGIAGFVLAAALTVLQQAIR